MKHVAFLRAINVSSKNLIKMAALRELFLSMGFADVATYLQSGNVVFESSETLRQQLEEGIESAIRNELGVDIKTLVRSADDLLRIKRDNPFISNGVEFEHLHLTILKKKIEQLDQAGIDKRKEVSEKYVLLNDCIYLYCPYGYGSTKLNNANWEKWSNSTGTTRNWRTVEAVIGMCSVTN